MAIQRPLDELALIVPDGIWADLDLVESDFTGFPPGKHVEEAAELSAVGGPQAVEDLNGPQRCTGLSDRLDRGGRKPLRPQLARAIGIHPDTVPAIAAQVMHNGQLGA